MNDIEQAVNKYTAQVIEYTLDAVKKTIDLYTDNNGMVKAATLKKALGDITKKGEEKA
jgi:rubrerythrin